MVNNTSQTLIVFSGDLQSGDWVAPGLPSEILANSNWEFVVSFFVCAYTTTWECVYVYVCVFLCVCVCVCVPVHAHLCEWLFWTLADIVTLHIIICDRIWENPPYGICARFVQCAFLVAKVKICQSPDFVIYVSNNPSSNCCRHLRRLIVLYKGEISLHFDPPSV